MSFVRDPIVYCALFLCAISIMLSADYVRAQQTQCQINPNFGKQGAPNKDKKYLDTGCKSGCNQEKGICFLDGDKVEPLDSTGQKLDGTQQKLPGEWQTTVTPEVPSVPPLEFRPPVLEPNTSVLGRYGYDLNTLQALQNLTDLPGGATNFSTEGAQILPLGIGFYGGETARLQAELQGIAPQGTIVDVFNSQPYLSGFAPPSTPEISPSQQFFNDTLTALRNGFNSISEMGQKFADTLTSAVADSSNWFRLSPEPVALPASNLTPQEYMNNAFNACTASGGTDCGTVAARELGKYYADLDERVSKLDPDRINEKARELGITPDQLIEDLAGGRSMQTLSDLELDRAGAGRFANPNLSEGRTPGITEVPKSPPTLKYPPGLQLDEESQDWWDGPPVLRQGPFQEASLVDGKSTLGGPTLDDVLDDNMEKFLLEAGVPAEDIYCQGGCKPDEAARDLKTGLDEITRRLDELDKNLAGRIEGLEDERRKLLEQQEALDKAAKRWQELFPPSKPAEETPRWLSWLDKILGIGPAEPLPKPKAELPPLELLPKTTFPDVPVYGPGAELTGGPDDPNLSPSGELTRFPPSEPGTLAREPGRELTTADIERKVPIIIIRPGALLAEPFGENGYETPKVEDWGRLTIAPPYVEYDVGEFPTGTQADYDRLQAMLDKRYELDQLITAYDADPSDENREALERTAREYGRMLGPDSTRIAGDITRREIGEPYSVTRPGTVTIEELPPEKNCTPGTPGCLNLAVRTEPKEPVTRTPVPPKLPEKEPAAPTRELPPVKPAASGEKTPASAPNGSSPGGGGFNPLSMLESLLKLLGQGSPSGSETKAPSPMPITPTPQSPSGGSTSPAFSAGTVTPSTGTVSPVPKFPTTAPTPFSPGNALVQEIFASMGIERVFVPPEPVAAVSPIQKFLGELSAFLARFLVPGNGPSTVVSPDLRAPQGAVTLSSFLNGVATFLRSVLSPP